MIRYLCVALAAATITFFAFAIPRGLAQGLVVNQAGSQFGPEALAVRVGQAITFNNDDRVAHNVASRSDGNAFNLGLMKPGTQSSHAFLKAGIVDVRCAIHPRMKMTITVSD